MGGVFLKHTNRYRFRIKICEKIDVKWNYVSLEDLWNMTHVLARCRYFVTGQIVARHESSTFP